MSIITVLKRNGITETSEDPPPKSQDFLNLARKKRGNVKRCDDRKTHIKRVGSHVNDSGYIKHKGPRNTQLKVTSYMLGSDSLCCVSENRITTEGRPADLSEKAEVIVLTSHRDFRASKVTNIRS